MWWWWWHVTCTYSGGRQPEWNCTTIWWLWRSCIRWLTLMMLFNSRMMSHYEICGGFWCVQSGGGFACFFTSLNNVIRTSKVELFNLVSFSSIVSVGTRDVGLNVPSFIKSDSQISVYRNTMVIKNNKKIVTKWYVIMCIERRKKR